MSMNSQFAGIYPAVLTPFADEQRLDLGAFAALIGRLYRAGVDGLYVGGNCGEWYLQTLEERKAEARVAVECSRGAGRVIVHVGCARTEDALDLARHAAAIGADAVSSLPPYIARWTEPEILRYYERLSSATPLPCFVYYFPALTGNGAGEGFFDAVRALPGVRGFKFTDMNLYELGHLAARAEGRIVLNGHDQVLLPALLMGAAGGIGSFYNVVPEQFVALFRAWRAGDLACARSIQMRINSLIRVVKRYRLVPALKHITRLQGLDLGICRQPTLALSGEDQQGLAAALAGLAEGKEVL